VVALIALGTLLFVRSRRKSQWAAEAKALSKETREVVDLQLPPVLGYVDPQLRSLSWPAVETALVAVTTRWSALAETAPDEELPRVQEITRLLQELVRGVRDENDALLQGRDWSLLRPRIEQDRAAIADLLSPGPAPPPPAPPTGPTGVAPQT
jgi:hypothetical protein